MKKSYVLLAGLVLAVAVLLGGARVANASGFHSGGNVSLPAGKAVQDTVYATGRTIDISNEVYGDVFCAGQNVTISGTVHGDVLCAGQSVTVSGIVDGDVRLAGQNVTLSAAVAGNATIAGQSFVLQSKASIGGDATIGSSDTTINGSVGRDVVAGGDSIVIASKVGRNITAGATKLTLSSGARIGGTINLTSKENVTKAPGAVVTGKITRTEPSQDAAKPKNGAVFGFGFVWFLYLLAAMLFTALALALLFPRLLQSATNNALPRPWKALLTGFVAAFAAPVLIITLAATLIGIPLAILLGLVWVVILFLSGPLFGYYLGRLVLREPRHALLTMLVGSAILAVLYFIPIIGGIAVLAALWIGSGMLLLEAFGRTPRPSYETVTALPPEPTARHRKNK